MSERYFDKSYGANPAENYERYFVPAIGRPLATELVRMAAIQPGERVLDVACGTGIVARLAREQVGSSGGVAAVDVNPGMLAVARSVMSSEAPVEFHEASAEALPLPDETFNVVFCQMGLQFVSDKPAAIGEMRRVACAGGRVFLNMPGPAGEVFVIMADALERHISREAAGFCRQVFSLQETAEIEQLMTAAGFRDVHVDASTGTLELPPPREFLWQYVSSTPLAGVVAHANESAQTAFERDVLAGWEQFEENGKLMCPQRIVVADARK